MIWGYPNFRKPPYHINQVQYYTQHSSKSESSSQLLLVEIWSPHEIRQGRSCLTSLAMENHPVVPIYHHLSMTIPIHIRRNVILWICQYHDAIWCHVRSHRVHWFIVCSWVTCRINQLTSMMRKQSLDLESGIIKYQLSCPLQFSPSNNWDSLGLRLCLEKGYTVYLKVYPTLLIYVHGETRLPSFCSNARTNTSQQGLQVIVEQPRNGWFRGPQSGVFHQESHMVCNLCSLVTCVAASNS